MSVPLPKLTEIDRLLIVKTSSIGDVVHALPVVEAIKQANPKLLLGWVVRGKSSTVLQGNPSIDRLHLLPNQPSLGDLISLRRTLHAEHYQCALDMQGLFLSGLITWLSGAPIRIGIDRNREGNTLFLTHPIVSGKVGGTAGDRHAVDILYGFAEALGVQAEHSDFAAQAYLADAPISVDLEIPASFPSPRIALNVGASSLYKQWPVTHWIVLANRLIAAGFGVVFVGDKNDAKTVAEVKSQLQSRPSIFDVSGQTDLRQLAHVLSQCALTVTADTGPMHLAVAVGTPVVALFGSTNPTRTGPYGARNRVLDMHLSCSPCYRNPTCNGRVDCMQAITPEMVFETVLEKLAPLPQ